jgi:hypothetical protein
MRHLLGSSEAANRGGISNIAARVDPRSAAMLFARVDTKEGLLETVFE